MISKIILGLLAVGAFLKKEIRDILKWMMRDFLAGCKNIRKDWRGGLSVTIGLFVGGFSVGFCLVGQLLSLSVEALTGLAVLALAFAGGLMWMSINFLEKRYLGFLSLLSTSAACCFAVSAATTDIHPIPGHDIWSETVRYASAVSIIWGPLLLCWVAVSTLVYIWIRWIWQREKGN